VIEEGSCLVWGDPHIKVFDEGSMQDPAKWAVERLVGIYAPGDFWLVRNEAVHIQARYWSTRADGQAHTRKVAIGGPFLENHTLLVEPLGGEILWDGQQVLRNFPSELNVTGLISARYHDDAPPMDFYRRYLGTRTVDVELPMGVRVTVNRWSEHIDVRITMRPLAGGQDGHCGNFNGDSSDDSSESIEARMGGEVSPASSMLGERGRALRYIGCFRDVSSDRDLPIYKGRNMGLKDCAVACGGSPFFGRQWLQECFCGASYGSHGRLSEEDCHCDDPSDIGGNRNCVYALANSTTPAGKTLTLADCSASVRARAAALCGVASWREGLPSADSFLESCMFDVCFAGEEYAEEDLLSERKELDNDEAATAASTGRGQEFEPEPIRER